MYDSDELRRYPYFRRVLEEVPPASVHDALTGLVARPYMIQFIRDLIERGTPFALGILDLDNFKTFNDTYGHRLGDMVLSRVAEDLRTYLGSDGVAGRFGGDEFLVVYLKSTAYEEVHAFFKAMYQSGRVLRRTIAWNGLDLYVTATLGCAAFPADGGDFDALFNRADKALYRGKSKGRNCYILYVAAKHEHLQIPTLTRRSLYETFRDMASEFDGGDTPREKLSRAFRVLRENLHVDRLLILDAGGTLTDADSGAVLARVADAGDCPGGVRPDTDLLNAPETGLRAALRDLGLESALFARVEGGDPSWAQLIFCPEVHTKRLWQDAELAAAFLLARMLSQHLGKGGKAWESG